MESTMIRVLSFDIDDTLYDFRLASCHALEYVRVRALEEAEGGAEALSLEHLIEDLIWAADTMEFPYARIHELRTRAFERSLERLDILDHGLAGDLSHLYLRHRFDKCELYSETLDLLSRLHGSYKICAVSNGEQDLARLGLEHFFDVAVFAEEVGVDKPHPRIFQIAMKHAGCSPAEFVHIGDSLLSDVAGAQAAGARGIWFNPKGRNAVDGVMPDGEIACLSQLIDALAHLS
jgi:FMN hydrolase / 5-amino-6-(5-phospho-D-ribitylamino)uracil phosphatase